MSPEQIDGKPADALGRNPRQSSSGASEAVEHTNADWSPDGRRLVYQHTEKTRHDIHTIEIDVQPEPQP